MDKLNATIVIVDDDRTLEERNIGLFLELRMNFGSVSVFLKQEDALNFISSNLGKRIIVLLDLDFAANPPDGNIVLESIRDISCLVPVIIWSGADENKEVFADLINNQAFGFLDKNASSEDIIHKLKEAYNNINYNIDVALEEWIVAHSEEQKKKPYMVTVEGKQLSLNDLLEEIRKQTPIGKQFSKSLSKLTIDLISRNKEKLND